MKKIKNHKSSKEKIKEPVKKQLANKSKNNNQCNRLHIDEFGSYKSVKYHLVIYRIYS